MQNYTVDQIKEMLDRVEAVQGGETFVRLYTQSLNALIIARGSNFSSTGHQELVNQAWTITLESLNRFDTFLQGRDVSQNQTRVA